VSLGEGQGDAFLPGGDADERVTGSQLAIHEFAIAIGIFLRGKMKSREMDEAASEQIEGGEATALEHEQPHPGFAGEGVGEQS
jgi:hypothetical protein